MAVEFEWTLKREHCGVEGWDCPIDPSFCRYECSAKSFIEDDETYPVWFTDKDRHEFTGWKEPGACPILFRDLATNTALRELKQAEIAKHRKENPAFRRAFPYVVTLRCLNPQFAVVIDGNKVLFDIAVGLANGAPDQRLSVTEVSGRHWPNAKHDFKIILNHLNAANASRG